jgi:hypothetical protein
MPTIEKDTYFKYLEHKGQAGYRAAILVKEQSAQLYSLLVASETVPSVFGTPDSFEFDLLNSPVKGKIAGKMSLDDKEVEVLHHRDNVYRFEKLKNKVLDFMVVDSNFVGYKFSGTLSYRMNDASADVLRGTYTITPMSADPNPVLDARSLCEETLCFADVVPDTIPARTGTSATTIKLSVVQSGATVAYSASKIAADGTETPDASAINDDVFTAPSTGGLYAITASATGYASWTTTVYVEA